MQIERKIHQMSNANGLKLNPAGKAARKPDQLFKQLIDPPEKFVVKLSSISLALSFPLAL